MSYTTELSSDALAEIALSVNTIQDPQALLEKVLEIAVETVEAERGFILLSTSGSAADFHVEASRNFTERQLGDVVRISTSVVNEVMATEESVVLYEALKDERYGDTESIVVEKIQSIACVPLVLKHRLIGAIYLDTISNRVQFDGERLGFLKAFANQAAVAIENARLHKQLRDENRRLRAEVQRAHGFKEIIGRSRPMKEVFNTLTRVLDTDATMLIEGESGTGKELAAKAIHYNGQRKDGPFVAVFCGSLPDELLESELFGHKRGAFTGAIADKPGLFEVADGGTVFLDEVGELSPRMQTSLLRVLQEGELKRVGETKVRRVDLRIISATNKSLEEMIDANDFREDLFYRLNTIRVTMPALRHRREDIALLANHFLDKYAVGKRANIRGFSSGALTAMEEHRWPGNVRELENAVERAVVMCTGDIIDAPELQLRNSKPRPGTFVAPEVSLKEMERLFVTETLNDHGGNISETARVLGVSRRWLHYRLKEWGSSET